MTGDSGSAAHEHPRRAQARGTVERDLATELRGATSRRRDAEADRRDDEANARDAAAERREARDAVLDAEVAAQQEPARRSGMDVVMRAARDRKLAAASRARAAVARDSAAHDRALARHDRVQAADDRRAAAEALAREGVDDLTGVLRRGVGVAAIGRDVERARRTGEPLVVAFIDVDGLKDVNDRLGHGAGDELLRGASDCIRAALRPYDVIMRFGGDEFVCALLGQGQRAARARFDGVIDQLAQHHGASLTVGFADYRDGEAAEDLILRADQAMLDQRLAT
jgi:diguanylate cyclase (GGDEF)-like protein